jgi:hypothetical protein
VLLLRKTKISANGKISMIYSRTAQESKRKMNEAKEIKKITVGSERVYSVKTRENRSYPAKICMPELKPGHRWPLASQLRWNQRVHPSFSAGIFEALVLVFMAVFVAAVVVGLFFMIECAIV